MSKQFFKYAFVWGFVLWLIGYLLGIVLFMAVPVSMVGWIITPIGVAMTLWVLFKKVKMEDFRSFFFLSIVWTMIAILCDYFFLVKLFKPIDGYYKIDVYLYYMLTFTLPLLVGWRKYPVKMR